jgi:diguanylate cyclase (GGDEF)-like protein
MLTLTLLVLALSVVLQIVAAVFAMRAIQHSGRFRYPWLALAVALLLMVERRALPLVAALNDVPTDFLNSLFGLLISALMVLALFGLVRMLNELRKTETELRLQATTDPLTGLLNRRQLLLELDAEIRRAQRGGRPLSVLMLDLDHFKSVNDHHGHAIGDEVLIKAMALCRQELRSIDLLGRVGGEEFVAVLPDADADEALVAAERLRQSLAQAPLVTNAGPLTITISVGAVTMQAVPVAHANQAPPPHEILQQLLKHADDALYAAKGAGRNCVRVALENPA